MQASLCCKFIICFIFFLIAQPIFSQTTQVSFPDHEFVYSKNIAFAPSLIHSSFKPSNLSISPSTRLQPINYAYFRFLGATPSISGAISSTSPPQIFWAWGEGHPPHLKFTIDENPSCPFSTYEFDEAGDANISGNLEFDLQGKNISQRFDSNSKNPMPTPFSSSEFSSVYTTEGENKTAVIPKLGAKFDGVASVPYSVRRDYYETVISFFSDGKGSGCELHSESYEKTFSYPVSDSANWSVEHPAHLFLLLQPIDGEQISYQPQIKSALLSNSVAKSISLQIEGGERHSANFSTYFLVQDEFGLYWLKRKFSNQIFISQNNYSLYSNSTNLFLHPSSIDGNGKNYSYQYFAWLNSSLPQGTSLLSFEFSDDFGNDCNSSWNIQTRAGSGIYATNSSDANAFLTDEDANQPEISSAETNNSIKFEIPSSEKIRPSKEFVFSHAQVSSISIYFGALIIFILGLAVFWKKR